MKQRCLSKNTELYICLVLQKTQILAVFKHKQFYCPDIVNRVAASCLVSGLMLFEPANVALNLI